MKTIIAKYNYLREHELGAAFLESQSDIETNKVIIESIDKHIKRIKRSINKQCKKRNNTN